MGSAQKAAVFDSLLDSVGTYEKVTSLSSAKGLSSIPTGATHALIQAIDQNVRWRDDGTNPDASTGMQLAAGNDIWYVGNDLSKLSFIEESSGASINVLYYRATVV